MIYLFTYLAILGTIVSFGTPTWAGERISKHCSQSGININASIKVKTTCIDSRKFKRQKITVTSGNRGANGASGISKSGASIGGNGGNSGNTGHVSGFARANGGTGGNGRTGSNGGAGGNGQSGSSVTIGVSGNSAPGGAGGIGIGRSGANVSGRNGTPGSQIEVPTQVEIEDVDTPD